MKHVWDIEYCPKKEIAQMSVFELREYTKRLEEELTNKDKTIRAIIDGNRRKHGEWRDYSDEGYVECPFCEHATTCNDDIEELHYCFFCGASLKGGE